MERIIIELGAQHVEIHIKCTDATGGDGHTNAQVERALMFATKRHIRTRQWLRGWNHDGSLRKPQSISNHSSRIAFVELWMHLVFRFRACSITFPSPVEWVDHVDQATQAYMRLMRRK